MAILEKEFQRRLELQVRWDHVLDLLAELCHGFLAPRALEADQGDLGLPGAQRRANIIGPPFVLFSCVNIVAFVCCR